MYVCVTSFTSLLCFRFNDENDVEIFVYLLHKTFLLPAAVAVVGKF